MSDEQGELRRLRGEVRVMRAVQAHELYRFQRRHKWFWGEITCPDGTDPQWATIHIRCQVCEEERDVWIGNTHNPPGIAYGCPGRVRVQAARVGGRLRGVVARWFRCLR